MIILGHRGGRGDGWPTENSVDAFARAMAEQADGVELDVRLSGDRDIVLWHDKALPDGAAVAQSPRGSLATLEEAFEVCRGKIVNVEIKADLPKRFQLVGAVARALARTRDVEVVVSSFDPSVVVAMAAASPRTPRAMLIGARTPRLAVALPTALRRLIVAAHLQDALLTPAVAGKIQKLGLRLVAWTVNSPARAIELKNLGLDWLITDEPGQMRDRLSCPR